MVKLATHVERRLTLGRKGYERVKDRFMERHMASRIASVLKQILQKSKRPSLWRFCNREKRVMRSISTNLPILPCIIFLFELQFMFLVKAWEFCTYEIDLLILVIVLHCTCCAIKCQQDQLWQNMSYCSVLVCLQLTITKRSQKMVCLCALVFKWALQRHHIKFKSRQILPPFFFICHIYLIYIS